MNTMKYDIKQINTNSTHTKKRFSLGIRARIFLGFIAIAFILIISTLYVNAKITNAANFSSEIAGIDLPAMNNYLDLNGYLLETQTMLSNYFISHDEKFKNECINIWKKINSILPQIDTHVANAEDANLESSWKNAKVLINQIQNIQNNIIDAIIANNQSLTTKMLLDELQPKIYAVQDILNGPVQADGFRDHGLFDNSYTRWEVFAVETAKELSYVKNIQYALLIFYLIAAILIAFVTARTILIPLTRAINIAQKIAAGDRNLDVTSTSNDETGNLLTALDIMLAAIKENELKLQENEANTRALFNNIVKTANAFSEHSSKVSKGDLTQRIDTRDTREMEQLGNDLNIMTENLSGIARRITETCHNMVTTLEEVKQSVDIQSTGASEQASSINEITASLEEIEKSSSQTIEKAKSLGELAERTREKGQLGLDAIEQSIRGMQEIREKVQTIAQTILDLSNQTQQVGEITNVVNSLAQQSKMLALNASIEAAKAGEAGKGFAVVAAEVKNLAEQSEHSTAQVQKILEDIRHATEKAVMATEEGTKGVDQGTRLVEQAGDVVHNLSDVIHETTIASEQIAAAIRQEGVGIEQITAGMNEINQVTSSFVASVKQTTEAMDNLASITKGLKENVDIYKL